MSHWKYQLGWLYLREVECLAEGVENTKIKAGYGYDSAILERFNLHERPVVNGCEHQLAPPEVRVELVQVGEQLVAAAGPGATHRPPTDLVEPVGTPLILMFLHIYLDWELNTYSSSFSAYCILGSLTSVQGHPETLTSERFYHKLHPSRSCHRFLRLYH